MSDESGDAQPVVNRTNGAHEFTRLDSTDRYVGKIVAVRVDEVLMPGGGRSRREVVEHQGAVAIVALDDADQVVLVHQYRYPLGRRLWELPAGLLDVPGEDPLRTAQRELAEEAGLSAQDWSVLVDVASSPGFTDESVRVFRARRLTPVERPEAVGNEEADLTIEWVSLAEAVQRVFASEIVNAPAVSGILAAAAARDGNADTRKPDAAWLDRPWKFAERSGH